MRKSSSAPPDGMRPRQVRVRVRSGPVNRSFLAATLCVVAAWMTSPNAQSSELGVFYHWLSTACAAASTAIGLQLLIRDYRNRRNLAISQQVSLDHGSARQSTFEERAARGMTTQHHGEFYGLDDDGRAIFRPERTPYVLIEAPPGAYKSASLVMGSILHRARLMSSVVIPDVKAELAAMLARKLRQAGYEVWIINPSRAHFDVIGDMPLNVYQALFDALYGDETARKDAVKLVADYAALHYPTKGIEEKNIYFALGSRRAIILAILSIAMLDPAGCTPTAVYELLTDPESFLKRCTEILAMDSIHDDDQVLKVLKLEARNLLHRAAENEENFASFLEGASQRFLAFNPSGHLGYYGREAIHNLRALRERQIILFIVTPLSHMREFADFISLLNHNIIAACKAKPDGHPIHIVGEEALNYRFHDLVADLETMRELRVTADFYVTSFAGLERHYGKEAAAAIEAYADIRIYAGMNSFARAKHVSDMLSDSTIRKQDYSYGASVEELNLSSREMARPLMKPDEILAMPRDQAWMFVRGMHPVRITLKHYGQISPWRDWVDAGRISGTRLYGEPVLHIDYPNGGNRDA